MSYKVESVFEHEGLKCVVLMTSMGHRCGYVGVPKEHPLHGKDYNDKSEYLFMKDLENEPIGKRSPISILSMAFSDLSDNARIDYYFNVHGGITYAEGNKTYPIESDNLWWFGFDCAHYDDGKDLDLALEYGLIDRDYYEKTMEIERLYPSIRGTARSIEYCEDECRSLAKQLSAIKKEIGYEKE